MTPNFTAHELIRSPVATRLGIDNRPDADVFARLKVLAAGLERVRAVLAVPIYISSGYRCPRLNQAVGGSRNSAHMMGLAADFTADKFGDPRHCAIEIAAHRSAIDYDQLILEGDWVHVAFTDGKPPRGENLTAHFTGGRPHYMTGIV